MPMRSVSLDELTVDDEASFAHVGLYQELKRALRASGHQFLFPEPGTQRTSWDRALFLNLTFWSSEQSADVLCDEHIPADVVAHVAWHHVVSRELAAAHGPRSRPSARALLFAESIASAFDLYLVGRLLPNAPDSDFLSSQVPIMGQAAEQAGLSEDDFASLMTAVSRDPERAFEDLRALLLDVATELLSCRDAMVAQASLERFGDHRFHALLHHYELSNWILYARAYAAAPVDADEEVRRIDTTLREAPISLDWLAKNWVIPAAR